VPSNELIARIHDRKPAILRPADGVEWTGDSHPARGPLDPENQADQFASDLLLPDFMFRPRIVKMKRLVLSAVREIAEEFNVSLTATLLKLAWCPAGGSQKTISMPRVSPSRRCSAALRKSPTPGR
jgi:hypothetical protein